MAEFIIINDPNDLQCVREVSDFLHHIPWHYAWSCYEISLVVQMFVLTVDKVPFLLSELVYYKCISAWSKFVWATKLDYTK